MFDEETEEPTEYVVQADPLEASFWELPRESGGGTLRIHIASLRNPGTLACNKFAMSLCVPCERYQDFDAVFCKDCVKGRPDVVEAGCE